MGSHRAMVDVGRTRRVGVPARQRRHDGSIGHTQALDPPHPELLVDDGQPGLSPGEAISFLHIQTQLDFNKCSKYKATGYIAMGVLGFMFRVLAYGAEEAERLNHKHIGTEHLLLGLLREEKCFAADILHERGLRLTQVREEIARSSSEKMSANRPKESSLLSEFSRDLTQAAMDGLLDPLIGRDGEVDRVVQILCRRTKNNPVLIGEPGVGKTAIVEGVAQRLLAGGAGRVVVVGRTTFFLAVVVVAFFTVVAGRGTVVSTAHAQMRCPSTSI